MAEAESRTQCMQRVHVQNKTASCDPECEYIQCKEKASLLGAFVGVAQAMETLLMSLKLRGSDGRGGILTVSRAV